MMSSLLTRSSARYDRAMPIDLLIRGGTLIDGSVGSGARGRPARNSITRRWIGTGRRVGRDA